MKAKQSVQRKVGRRDAAYEGLGDVQDLLGLRIITFFPDEVDRVAKLIEAEFRIDSEHSVDKRALLDPDRFGYLSRHYVAELSEERACLREHARFKGLCFEIQIRSILQHAWAEIEHDLGYHAAAIPASMRRRFSRLAGLLEIADDEFQTLRNEASEYQQSVDEGVEKDPASVTIDQDSITAFIAQDQIRNLDAAVAEALGRLLINEPGATAGGIAAKLNWVGLKTIAEVQSAVERNSDRIVTFASRWIERSKHPPRTQVNGGISLFYLAYIMATESNSHEHVTAYLEAQSIGPTDERPSIAGELLDTFQGIT